jgi:hypothetical protein
MKSMPMRGERTATHNAKKANPFGKPETKKNEAAGMKMMPGKKPYAAMAKGMKK